MKRILSLTLLLVLTISATAVAQSNRNAETLKADMFNERSVVELKTDMFQSKKTMVEMYSVELEEKNAELEAKISSLEEEIKEMKVAIEATKEAPPVANMVASRGGNERIPYGFVFNQEIRMPLEHQIFLYNKCIEHGLNYKKTLAVVGLESDFRPDIIAYGGVKAIDEEGRYEDYGYMQVNQINHESISKRLNTPIKPLDPYVNITWGTQILKDLYKELSDEYTGKELDLCVLSAYNMGLGGFRKNGIRKVYVDMWHDEMNMLTKQGF